VSLAIKVWLGGTLTFRELAMPFSIFRGSVAGALLRLKASLAYVLVAISATRMIIKIIERLDLFALFALLHIQRLFDFVRIRQSMHFQRGSSSSC